MCSIFWTFWLKFIKLLYSLVYNNFSDYCYFLSDLKYFSNESKSHSFMGLFWWLITKLSFHKFGEFRLDIILIFSQLAPRLRVIAFSRFHTHSKSKLASVRCMIILSNKVLSMRVFRHFTLPFSLIIMINSKFNFWTISSQKRSIFLWGLYRQKLAD